MKKVFAIAFVLTLFAFNSQSQNSITFKQQYAPETTYSQTAEQTTQSEVTYRGPKAFLKSLQENGVKNPTITSVESTIETVLKNGKVTDGTTFPVTMEIVKATYSDGSNPIPDGMLIYGHGTTETMPILDSIVWDGISEELKKILLTTMQRTFEQLNVPEREVTVGESFSVETPLAIPIADETLEMLLTTNYTLVSIANGLANFDVTQEYSMKVNVSGLPFSGTGSGKGKMVYDVANYFTLKSQTTNEMVINVDAGKFAFDLKTKVDIVQTAQITKNETK